MIYLTQKKIFLLPKIFFTFMVGFFVKILNINFFELRGDKLGYLAFQQDILIYLENKKRLTKNRILFYNVLPINKQLKKMWDAKFKKKKFSSIFKKFNVKKIFIDIDPNENYQNYIDNSKPPINFTDDEETMGKEFMDKIGLKYNNFFCFNNRDFAQFGNKNMIKYYEKNSSYRNFLVDDLKISVKYLTNKGLQGVFYGYRNEQLNWDEKKIIDYPSLYKSDFLDIFLIAKSKFYLGPNSGPMALSTLFRKPTIQVNVAPILGTAGYYSKKDIFIPKKIFSIKKNRFLSLREIMSSGAINYYTDNEYEENSLKIVNNLPEEILDAVSEMIKNLENKFEDQEDSYEQKDFNNIIKNFSSTQNYNLPKISTSFLKRNSYFLN